MISASRSGRRFSPAKRLLISKFHSGMLHSCDATDGSGKLQPLFALQRQDTLSFAGQPVVAPPPLICFFHPTSLDPAPLFEPVEQGIERGHVKMKRPAGAHFDEFGDFVPVERLVFQQGQNQEFRTPFLPLLFYFRSHIWASHISYVGRPSKISR